MNSGNGGGSRGPHPRLPFGHKGMIAAIPAR